ncbi:cation-translocating P-type ATPase [Novosphingobium sp. KCTC 2891]|uniref:cation-translocating P-type ATPase n=1 Tax=Novosphingobium sp. KCTC 2891 TaxID=2989730 RepID=UPI00222240E5|nr:cation-translocating P-type ATPase [Novosphingobium sp. KCTC 2891]MCW1381589.1 cation-translocating P-type ATPase [Novosphingobium sp. KCTC 2891]
MTSLPDNAMAGLSATQVRERLARDGPNELPRQKKRPPWRIALDVLREPMLAMLLVAGGAYLLLGETSEALILIVFAGFSVAVTIVQEARTENVLDSLRDLSAPRALVIRDGETVRIPGRDVVEGDILLLDPGDRIAADALLIEARELESDESLLTGESVPVRKRPAGPGDAGGAEPGGDDKPQVYAGAIVTHGSGTARVMATGPRSRIGAIGRSLAAMDTEAPRLQRETSRIVRICAVGGIAIAVLVFALYGLLRGGWLDALLAGIAIGMSLLPEEFPVVLTIFLAMGAWRIAQAGVLTRRGSAIETMGATTVLCSDKTGTLTQNRMVAAQLWMPDGTTASVADGQTDSRFHALLQHGALASAPVPVDPMEVAFHEAANGIATERPRDWTLVHTCGLSPELLAMSNIWQSADADAPLVVAAKGAPEAVARLCRLDPAAQARLEAAATAMAARGMRVLGVASAQTGPANAVTDHRDHQFDLLGLIGLLDPLRPGVKEAVAQCRSAGIRVVMITGDYAATAQAIAADAGIAQGETLTGAMVATLSDTELAERLRTVSICARTMPEQKLRIVNALKAAGEVVAMTGDGVNDAPALKAAHIGIAMGKRGTDVAREAASIVLVEDDFGAIVSAIRLGRRIYDNIRKAMGFIFGVHVPIAGLAVLPLLLGMPILLGPIQIALLEMIIDPVCALVFEAEREERQLMQRPPRAPDERLFSAALVVRSVAQGGLALLVLAALLIGGQRMGLPPAELRTLMFFALVAAVLALVLAHRSFSARLSHAVLRHNTTFRYVVAFIAAGSAAILGIGPVQRWLGFAPLAWSQIALATGTGLLLLVMFEAAKAVAARLAPRETSA